MKISSNGVLSRSSFIPTPLYIACMSVCVHMHVFVYVYMGDVKWLSSPMILGGGDDVFFAPPHLVSIRISWKRGHPWRGRHTQS